MEKFRTEGPVSVNSFISFINLNTAQKSGNSLKNSFDSAKIGGAFLPQGDFDKPHALSESYGAEAGFLFYVNNNGKGTPHYSSSHARPLVGHFYSEFKWAMDIGEIEHSMVFPYRNYMYDISQTASQNGCFGSNDQTYRKIDCKLYHSNVDKNSREREPCFGVSDGIKDLFFAFGFSTGSTVFYYDEDEGVELYVILGSEIDIGGEKFTVQDIGVQNGSKFLEVDRSIDASQLGDANKRLSISIALEIGITAGAQNYIDAKISQADQDHSYILDPWVTYRAKTYHSDHFDQMIFPQESAFQKAGSQYAVTNAYAGDGVHYESVLGWAYAFFGYNGRIIKTGIQIPGTPITITFTILNDTYSYTFPTYQTIYTDTPAWPSTQLNGATYWFYHVPASQSIKDHPHPSIRGFYNEIGQATQSDYIHPNHGAPSYRWGWISPPNSSLGKGGRISCAERYFYLNDLYNIVHQEDAWRNISLLGLSPGETPYDVIFGNDKEDFFSRYRRLPSSYQSYSPFDSNPGGLGKNSIDNSRLRLIDPGASITDQNGKAMMIDDGTAEFNKTTTPGTIGKAFDHWNGCDWQLFMTRLSEYPEKVPVYLRAGDHGHGYIEVTPESTLRYHIEKIGNDFKIFEESSILLSEDYWSSTVYGINVNGDTDINVPDEWNSSLFPSSVVFYIHDGFSNYDKEGPYMDIYRTNTNESLNSDLFFTNINTIPSKKIVITGTLTYGVALVYINDVLFLSVSDTFSFSFVPNEYQIKLSICPLFTYTKLTIDRLKVAQEGAVLPEQYFTKNDAIEAWSKLHYNEHDYYYNNSYNDSEQITRDITWTSFTGYALIANDIWPSGGFFFELSNFQVSSSFSASSKTEFEIFFYINKTDGQKAIARKSIAVYPSAPARKISRGEEDVFRPAASIFQLWNECEMADGTTSSVNAVPYSSVNSTVVSKINLRVAHDGFYTNDFVQCEYYYSNDLKNWSSAFDSVDLNADTGGLISINFGDAAFPSYPTNLTDQYIYYRARWIAGPNCTQHLPGTILAEDILEFGSIADNNRITVLHNNNFHYYRTDKDFFPVDTDGLTSVSDLANSEGEIYVFEGLRFLKLSQRVDSAIFPEANEDDFNWQITYPFTPGINLENLANSNLDSDWNNVKKPNKRIYQSAWQFIHNLRLRSEGHDWTDDAYTKYPGMEDETSYVLGGKHGPLAKEPKSAISILRFESLRKSMVEYAVLPEASGNQLKVLFKRHDPDDFSNIGSPDSSGQDSNGWFEELKNSKELSGQVSISPSSKSGSYWKVTGLNTSFVTEILLLDELNIDPNVNLNFLPYTVATKGDITILDSNGKIYEVYQIVSETELLLYTEVENTSNDTFFTPYSKNEKDAFLSQKVYRIHGEKSAATPNFTWNTALELCDAAINWDTADDSGNSDRIGEFRDFAQVVSIYVYKKSNTSPTDPLAGVYNFADSESPLNMSTAGWKEIPEKILDPEDKIWVSAGATFSLGEQNENANISWRQVSYEHSRIDDDLIDDLPAGSAQVGSITGPIYQDIKYLPRSNDGLKLNVHYLIDLPMVDRLQIEMAARFWESIILDNIEVDVLVMPTVTRDIGGTFASATIFAYLIGEDSAFHSQNRAQIKRMGIYLDTDDIIPGAAPDSSYTATGRENVLEGSVPGGNRLCHILIHEIAHGLGIGTNWNVEFVGHYEDQYQWGFANEFGSQYNGPEAVSKYIEIVNSATHIMLYSNQTKKIEKTSITSSMRSNFYTDSVPIEGGSFAQEFQSWQDGDIAGGHIAEYAKKAGGRTQPTFVELMSPIYDVANSPITRLTIGYLADLGYQVNYNQAQSIGKPEMATQSSGEQILIGYTGTEYYKWIFYNPGGDADNFGGFTSQQRAEYGADPDSTEDSLSGIHLFLSEKYEEVKDRLTAPKLVSCNCKTHKINATKNSIMPYGISE